MRRHDFLAQANLNTAARHQRSAVAIDARTAPYATLLLRIGLGALFVLHLYRKVSITGMSSWWSGFIHAGYPAWTLYYDLTAETIAAVALLLGLYTRWACWLALPVLLGASQYMFKLHGFWFSGGGAELPLLWSTGLIVLGCLGDGAFALGRLRRS